MNILSKIKSLFTKKEFTMYNQSEENELTNIFLSFLVVASLLLFPVPVWGIVAVVAWLAYLIVAIARRYSNRGIAIIAVIFTAITIYQAIATPAHLEELRLTTMLFDVSPEEDREFRRVQEVEITLINENVQGVEYQWSSSRGYNPNGFETLDIELNETVTLTLSDKPRGGYYLVFRLDYKEGQSNPILFYGRYNLDYPDQ